MTTTTKYDPTSLFFGLLLFGFGAYFLFWGLGYTDGNFPVVFTVATVFGLFMAFNIGGNDVANSFGTSVGAGTLTLKQALLVAAIFEVSGAVLAGGEVTNTIRGDIVDLEDMHVDPMDFVFIMMSALLAAALWLLFASRKGYPVSTTHSIIGGIVGASIALGIMLSGVDSAFALVHWNEIGIIAVSWVISPLLGGLASYGLFHFIKYRILHFNDQMEEKLQGIKDQKRAHKEKHKRGFERLDDIEKIAYASALARDAHVYHEPDFDNEDLESEYYQELTRLELLKKELNSHHALETFVPAVAAVGAIIIAGMLLFKGLQNLNLGLSTLNNILIMGMVGASIWVATLSFAKTMRGKSPGKSTFLLFSWMQVLTASAFAFSHGSNDIANAIGPFAAIIDVLRTGVVGESAAIPAIAMVTFGVSLVAGLWFIGREVIMTVGHHITAMHPASGFSAELSAAAVVLLASLLGIPVSSTHILIGAVLGIGMVNRQTNWGLMRPIALAWVITLPAAAGLSALFLIVLRAVF